MEPEDFVTAMQLLGFELKPVWDDYSDEEKAFYRTAKRCFNSKQKN